MTSDVCLSVGYIV